MQIVRDALEFVRSKPEMFFPLDGKPSPLRVLPYLMSDVIELGGGTCTIRRSHDWWIIASDKDWFDAPYYKLSEVELFARIVPAPQHGPNSMRGEILVAGFFHSVWTTRDEQRTCIQGDAPPPAVWDDARGFARAIVFSSQPAER